MQQNEFFKEASAFGLILLIQKKTYFYFSTITASYKTQISIIHMMCAYFRAMASRIKHVTAMICSGVPKCFSEISSAITPNITMLAFYQSNHFHCIQNLPNSNSDQSLLVKLIDERQADLDEDDLNAWFDSQLSLKNRKKTTKKKAKIQIAQRPISVGLKTTAVQIDKVFIHYSNEFELVIKNTKTIQKQLEEIIGKSCKTKPGIGHLFKELAEIDEAFYNEIKPEFEYVINARNDLCHDHDCAELTDPKKFMKLCKVLIYKLDTYRKTKYNEIWIKNSSTPE